jgi:IS1 family transposase/transposase-like protein
MLVHTVILMITCFYLIGSLASWLALAEWRWLAKVSDSRKQSEQVVGETAALKADNCPACQAAGLSTEARPSPPPRIEQKRGRRRSVDTRSHYCPNERCAYYGWVGLGNIRSNGHAHRSRWRQLECVVCHTYFMETINTIFYRKRVPAELIWQVLTALAEGLGIRATARVFDLDPNTVEAWLRQAGQQMTSVSHYLIHDLHLTQVQVDELWALLGQQDVDETSQKQRAKRWVWTGMDLVSKLWLAYVVGNRSQEYAQLLIHAIVLLLAPGCFPLFISDQWSAYGAARLTHFGYWVQLTRRGTRGPLPKPRWQPLPQLQYAQVVKQRFKGRVVSVSHRVIYGSLETVEVLLAQSVGQVVNTAFTERLNLSIRQHVSALGRKVATLAKGEAGLDNLLVLYQAYYNFCLPHTALRLALLEPRPTKGAGSYQKWTPRTPAMAASLTDRIWRMEELLLFRVPPWPQRQTLPA